MVLNLSVTGKPVYVNPENIAYVSEEEITKEDKQVLRFSRVAFKVLDIPDDTPKWIDVKEDVKTIAKLIKRKR